jgi:hypothetical protein
MINPTAAWQFLTQRQAKFENSIGDQTSLVFVVLQLLY